MEGAIEVSRAERVAEEVFAPVAHRHGMTLREVQSDPRTVTVTWSGPAGELDVVVDRVDGTVETVVSARGGGRSRSLEELAHAAGDDELVRRLSAASDPGCELGARLAHHAEVLDRTLGR